MIPHLLGLVLSGGESRRMGTDKALIRYKHLPAVLETYVLIKQLTGRCLISCKPEQWIEWTNNNAITSEDLAQSGFNKETDLLFDVPEFSGAGPLTGVLSAMKVYPDSAWLVTGCDYPLLTREDYTRLLEARSEQHNATVVIDPFDARPLPLPAIYEPALIQPFKEIYSNGHRSMRVVLQEMPVHIASLSEPRHLQSIDHPTQVEIVQLLFKQ